ncbi:hypothetical protein P154DRAFT_526604 [Amniculicola lignicola CBS 123094]|uniref:Zn(2)-C6 fungal-type domain-containing protein n=1 Tax=Amniculicola lignicola CBS 123094 TaxID=1392246 RepID=A0A6A5W2H3_9PLEO|nr:hypothetical protein P154DRAFT_526604 [Amniculicola lignicola CBS 123094]
MATPARRTQKFRTSCDRCYELKERCVRGSVSADCLRCDRLNLVCSNDRPVRPPGRRPRHRKEPSSGTTSSPSSTTKGPLNTDFDAWLQNVPDHDLSRDEKELISLLGQPDSLEFLVVCPSFQAAEQQSLAAPLPAAFPILKNSYLAFAGSLKSLQLGIATEESKSANLRHASLAMEMLRSLPVVTPQDAALCLFLGTTLALFVYSAIGVGVGDICYYCLSTTSSFTARTITELEIEPWQNMLVLLETMECLVYRRKPTLRISLPILERVDRHIGLCLPLLPHYYDLCIISHSLANATDESYLARLHKQLDASEIAIQEWIPSHPPQILDDVDSAELVNLLAQAKVYRLAALLVGHRLRHDFGNQDEKADVLSKEIMMELEIAWRITKRPMRCVTLPFIVAAVEVRASELRLKTLQNVDNYVDKFTTVIQEATRKFLSRIWHERDMNTTFCWFDSISKPCAVLHAVDLLFFA